FFLQESHAEQEITLYRRTLPNATPIRGLGELYRHHGKGGILGDALVAVGMREGEGSKAKPAGISAEDLKPKRRIIPLSHRLAAFTDATTQELGDMTKQARAANQAKSHFLSSMSHEIRTPINAVLGMNEMILRESREPEILSYASNVQSAAKSLLGIVNDILDFSKIEAGKMEIIPAEYELPSMLNDLVTLLKGRAEDKGLQFTVDADARLPRMLMGDEIRIKQVITNLLTNAVKYTKQGSVTLKVGFQPASGEAILLQASIIDTGIGIKEEDIPKLFSAFERIEEKRNRAIEGTGLGMNITKRILSLMGADLKVESRYGQGSTFSFQVEQKVVDATPVGEFADACKSGARMHQAYHKSFEAPDARILVVDDTEMNLTVVKGLLKQTKVKIDTAVSGQECLSMIAKNKYDIIFLDHLMPRMDGIATLREMKRMPGHPNEDTPVISLTANAISGAREEYIAAGFSDYLTKPIDSTELEGMIRNYLPPELVMAPADDAAQEREDNVLPDWVTQIKDLEADAGRKHCGGAKAYLEALGVFYESIERGADEIEKYWQDGNIEDYTTKVHALKSSARIIGATELSRRAEWLEAAGKQGNADEIQCDTPVLLALYRSYIQKLKPIARKSISQGNLPGITSEELDDAYASLREFAMSFDYDSIRYVMESLSSYRLPDAQQPRYERLRSAIERLDWEAIQEEL
ncbi:MAG: response regulator, partial [Selenomonadaceae bacterium]|nr:response regulator [Selenomonadaceae bacterium]